MMIGWNHTDWLLMTSSGCIWTDRQSRTGDWLTIRERQIFNLRHRCRWHSVLGPHRTAVLFWMCYSGLSASTPILLHHYILIKLFIRPLVCPVCQIQPLACVGTLICDFLCKVHAFLHISFLIALAQSRTAIVLDQLIKL